ncbi:hypothetical protein KVR01_012165 [Diaporthe batatas]|uniref:uncharacterized protein n=1 Tax=Diaporthe batatas TaxID=748121 RepID=UPI001D0527FF|nr:uncharacterized protein KVR01_012165 [Diaporthe batatas]KAG8157893.1 hypothetical protein KVR01_012165 [Diaporthe batatas]
MSAFGVAKLVINDRHTLYMMPHCGCGINQPAFDKWVEATSGDPVCPVSGCGALLDATNTTVGTPELEAEPMPDASPQPFPPGNVPRGITDRLTLDDEGEAVKVTADQIGPFEPTPFPDRDYADPNKFVVSRKTGKVHTRISKEKMEELRMLPKDEFKKKIARIHRADNKAWNEALPHFATVRSIQPSARGAHSVQSPSATQPIDIHMMSNEPLFQEASETQSVESNI